jgi:hypothetical protein
MIVHDHSLTLLVHYYTLSTGRIYVIMAREYSRTAIFCLAALPVGVYIRTFDVLRPTNCDTVFIAGFCEFGRFIAAFTDTEEEIVKVGILEHGTALDDRGNVIVLSSGGVIRDDGFRWRIQEFCGWILEGELMDAVPVTAEYEHAICGVGIFHVYKWIDQVVSSGFGEPETAVVCPCPGVE